MNNIILVFLLSLTVSSCGKKLSPRSAALPDNVVSDKPIVLKEGQAIVLMKEGDPNLKIGAAVVDGKLSIADLNTKGRNFEVTWKDSKHWETATMVSDGENFACAMNRNMDGFADFKSIRTSDGLHRFELKGGEWVELKPGQKRSEQGVPPNDP